MPEKKEEKKKKVAYDPKGVLITTYKGV